MRFLRPAPTSTLPAVSVAPGEQVPGKPQVREGRKLGSASGESEERLADLDRRIRAAAGLVLAKVPCLLASQVLDFGRGQWRGGTMPQRSNWQVAQVRAETVEVTNAEVPEVKYVLYATKGALRLQVWANDELAEETLVSRGVNEFIFESSDLSGSRIRLAMSPTEHTTVTHLLINDEEFRVESPAGEHPFRIDAELRDRQLPDTNRTRLLADALRQDDALRSEIKRQTEFGTAVIRAEGISNGAIAACVAVCFLCALGNFAFCVACSICVELRTETPLHT
jgi:hypothetical protein